MQGLLAISVIGKSLLCLFGEISKSGDIRLVGPADGSQQFIPYENGRRKYQVAVKKLQYLYIIIQS
jgi:hypothetical protein